ncbi:hypothetical protein [Yunchengibacter salinarum]|uniref:hypothetical protein n=1 Tax=Yunchengibacter salinarum TaxID=3133399 RepID=UPI0035B64153
MIHFTKRLMPIAATIGAVLSIAPISAQANDSDDAAALVQKAYGPGQPIAELAMTRVADARDDRHFAETQRLLGHHPRSFSPAQRSAWRDSEINRNLLTGALGLIDKTNLTRSSKGNDLAGRLQDLTHERF